MNKHAGRIYLNIMLVRHYFDELNRIQRSDMLFPPKRGKWYRRLPDLHWFWMCAMTIGWPLVLLMAILGDGSLWIAALGSVVTLLVAVTYNEIRDRLRGYM
jgi:hypothetical protein